MIKKEVSTFWDSEKEVGKGVVNASGKACLKTKLVEKDSKTYVDLRKFVNVKGESKGFKQHTSSGLAIEVESLDAIIKALQAVKAQLTTPPTTSVAPAKKPRTRKTKEAV